MRSRNTRLRNRYTAKRRLRLLPPLVAAGIVSGTPWAYGDTSVTLEGLGVTTNDPIPADHGSNAEAMLTWEDTWDQYADWNGRGDVYQVDPPIVSLSIAPTAASIRVTLEQFELDEWAGGGDTSANWSVTGSASGLLASGTWDPFNSANDPTDAGGRTVVPANAAGALGETLTLAIDHTDMGTVSYLAMDNLVFSTTVVPEPSASVLAWLSVSGLGAMAMRRKRRDAEC